MILISHRGNINGKDVENENNPVYIDKALEEGFDVEIDVWYKDGIWYLGHDEPKYPINLEYLKNNKFWCHAKNIDALNLMLENDIHCFWHQDDDVTITSYGFIWTSPDKKLTEKSICVLPEINNQSITKCAGICSDYITNWRN